MTTIEYGGAPTLEQKRQFSGLKDGSQIPGYRGHCPQLKFSMGKSFGRETFELAEMRRCRRHQTESNENLQKSSIANFQFSGKLPESTGDNKYMENMVPGYTGYVPRWPFKFGKRYKEECDLCLEEFICNQSQLHSRQDDDYVTSKSLPSLRAVSTDPQVRDHLNNFHQRTFQSSAKLSKREPTEPPIPGYRGYIPRIQTTEHGLGNRFHESTKSGLNSFYTTRSEREQKYGPLPDNFGAQRHRPQLNSFQRSKTCLDQLTADDNEKIIDGERRRLYGQNGMIPKYSGYVPQQRYTLGYTFGDETRSLDVCSHDKRCYGDYVRLTTTSYN